MHSVTVRMHSDSQTTRVIDKDISVHDIYGISVDENGQIYNCCTTAPNAKTDLENLQSMSDMGKMVEFLEWALSMVDENYKETGKIGFAEVIVYKAAKAHMLKMKEGLR